MIALLGLSVAYGATLQVNPADSAAYRTVGDAIAAAASGDRIEVADGSYRECIDAGGKTLTIAGSATLDGTGLCDATVNVPASDGALALEDLTVLNAGGRGVVVSGAALRMDRVTVRGAGRADWNGGAIWAENAIVTLGECAFEGNIGDYGGAVSLAAGVELADNGSVWSDNVATHQGGALFAATEDSVRLSDDTFEANSAPADVGGAVAVEWYSTFELHGARFRGNSAAGSGGAVFLYALYSAPLISESAFEDNTSLSGGGAVEAEWFNDLTITNTIFSRNSAGGYGGAVAIWYDSHGVVSDCTFEDNVTTGAYGGGVFLYPQEQSLYDLTVTGSHFAGNSAAGDGGALWTGWVRNASISDSTFHENVSAATGGGLLVYVAESATLTGNTFCRNTAAAGGGASVQWTTTDTWANDVFAVNSAPNGGGAQRYASYAGSMRNLTFVGNSASEWGGSYWAAWAYADFRNNLVAWTGDGNGIYTSEITTYSNTPLQYDGWHANSTIDAGGYFWVEGGTDGNVTGDPTFVRWGADVPCNDLDLRLATGSPMRDAGDPSLLDADGSRSDIGAYGGLGAPIEDRDGDGFDTTADCDDTNAAIHPGVAEVCDGVDNDCDHTADGPDASDAADWYTDADGDTYGDPATLTRACGAPDGATADATDCDDADPATHPGATDTPDDGIDQDCDGSDATADSGSDNAGDNGAGDTDRPTDTGDTGSDPPKSACGCTSTRGSTRAWVTALAVLGLVRRRRPR